MEPKRIFCTFCGTENETHFNFCKNCGSKLVFPRLNKNEVKTPLNNTMTDDTIAAISTPLGEGGIGMVRISGANAITVAERVFKPSGSKKLSEIDGYSALYGKVYSSDEEIDEAIALVFRAPKSYTGETVVEISVHGGVFLVKKLLRAVLSSGARLAESGEFTKRAFLNGKIDLSEAEAVMGLISAQGEQSLRSALNLKNGGVSKKITEIRDNLLNITAAVSVYTDYPDDELPEYSDERLKKVIPGSKTALKRLIETYDTGKILREGVSAVLAGKPNAGKSSIMNLLLKYNRSIVTAVPGTTRDVIEESVKVGDILLKLSDTAGLRDTTDEVENIGVSISKEKIESAEIILAVFDRSEELTDEDIKLLNECEKRPSVAIINKTDIEKSADMSAVLESSVPKVYLSAETGDGLLDLEKAIADICNIKSLSPTEAVLGSERQLDCVRRAVIALEDAENAFLMGMTLDAVGICVDDALSSLYELTGERVTNAVADEVFSKFCVGK